ncbi:hypothetical protein JAB6_46440 [Janthinobacterium sp. HH104]|uniref:hypothetical protein n=1 Tax=Janthinobacterium sp. HH104 TaxID=1537276 RepID=UPI000873580B|nr:hypothetical protein [Janthinobacterium sp. HH104]OEZ80299.1 hypothetical protein JAB6_46440 [Janthinobacterium sp. HH104]
MDQYKEFCRLRDYRQPGAEVPQHTEAEAFASAIARYADQRYMALAARHESVLDGAILMAEEFSDARTPSEGGHAFRTYAEILRGLKTEHALVAIVAKEQHLAETLPKTPTTITASTAARSIQ